MSDAPATPVTAERVAGYVILVVLGLIVGTIAGFAIGLETGLIPFVC